MLSLNSTKSYKQFLIILEYESHISPQMPQIIMNTRVRHLQSTSPRVHLLLGLHGRKKLNTTPNSALFSIMYGLKFQ